VSVCCGEEHHDQDDAYWDDKTQESDCPCSAEGISSSDFFFVADIGGA
jgi:hypothetical protein